MKTGMTLLALTAIITLVTISTWATGHIGVMAAIRDLLARPRAGNNPWFIATLFDTFFAFLWFWLWVAYKETGWIARIVWLLLIFTLGNMAMGAYVLIQLLRLPAGAGAQDLLLRRG
ncbi:MAG: DUF1475 family protein [Stenotrophobium sp.]